MCIWLQMEEEKRMKVELQQKPTGIQNEETQLKTNLQEQKGEYVMDEAL